MRSLTRRTVLFGGAAFGVGALLPRRSRGAAPADERFLLTVTVAGGLDGTMLFDARPLAMTEAGAIHNPLGEDPAPWGDGPDPALTASTAAALHPLRDYFSVVNGVVMSTAFDGHEQNANLLMTGTPTAGAAFHTAINAGVRPLDFVRLGPAYAEILDGKFVELTPVAASQLAAGVRVVDQVAPELDGFLAQRHAALGVGNARFAAGVRALEAATGQIDDLAARVRGIELPADHLEDFDGSLALIGEVFRRGIARSAVLSLGDDFLAFDTHAPDAAAFQGDSYLALCEQLAQVLAYLRATPYDDRRSLFDVTTVLVASEFGRTMRQADLPIDATGTDHNPLATTVLVAGAGIRGGQVIGSSDFRAADEVLSGAHLALDPGRVSVMGRPFDFAAGRSRADMPAVFQPGDYLQIGSVINTIYSLFGVDRAAWRLTERNGDVAPVVPQLLA